MKKLFLITLLAASACSSMNQPATTAAVPQNSPTGTHVPNDSSHPCSVSDTRRGSCY